MQALHGNDELLRLGMISHGEVAQRSALGQQAAQQQQR